MRTETSDFDLHGIVGIRLLNATPGDIAAVNRQLGPINKPLTRTPDIVIRFVDRLSFSSPVRYLGLDDAGFTDDAFLVFRGKHQARIRVQIPFDQIGNSQCEIVCESGVPAVPLLLPILNLTAISKGVLPLHASALIYDGKGILLTGWAKGGKTETLLAFAANGAEYVGDEWVYLSSDGQHMYGIPEPIRVLVLASAGNASLQSNGQSLGPRSVAGSQPICELLGMAGVRAALDADLLFLGI